MNTNRYEQIRQAILARRTVQKPCAACATHGKCICNPINTKEQTT